MLASQVAASVPVKINDGIPDVEVDLLTVQRHVVALVLLMSVAYLRIESYKVDHLVTYRLPDQVELS